MAEGSQPKKKKNFMGGRGGGMDAFWNSTLPHYPKIVNFNLFPDYSELAKEMFPCCLSHMYKCLQLSTLLISC